jgi:hypothetical protein
MMAVVPVAVSVPCPAGCSRCARKSPAPLWAVLGGTGQLEWADVSAGSGKRPVHLDHPLLTGHRRQDGPKQAH